MKIGTVLLPDGAVLAPMAGVTDMPFRVLCHEMGSSFAVSEMLSAKGYLYAPKDCRASVELLARSPQEGVTALQLFGHERDLMAEAANQLQDLGFGLIDVNMGCPAKKITGNGDGSALMKRPETAGGILRAMVKKTRLPVTVKIRAGWDERSINAVELAQIAEDAGVSAITVHGRTREQFYTGKADWSIIRAVREAVQIPVIGNGDVTDGETALEMIRQTGCAGVAIGRAAQGNPWIFREILSAMRGEAAAKPSFEERARMALRHFELEEKMRGEKGAVLEMRKHIAWYLCGARGCAKLRTRINGAGSAEEVRAVLEEAKQMES